MPAPWLLSRPRYQNSVAGHEAVPRLTLKRARMSATPGSRSTPSSFSESAAEYQVAGLPPVTSRHTSVAPAEPSVAPVAVQVSGSKVARMLTGTVLVSVAPQMLAAYW